MKSFILRSWAWILIPFVVIAFVVFVAYKQHRAADNYESDRQSWCATLPSTAPEEQASCADKGPNRDNYLGWGYKLVAWPDGITVWAIIATGFVIGWQSWETRKAAKATGEGAIEMRRQNRNMVAKERALFSVNFPLGSETMTVRPGHRIQIGDFRILLSNIGGTSAYNVEVGYCALACESDAEPAFPCLYGVVAPTSVRGGEEAETNPLTIEQTFVRGVPLVFEVVVVIAIAYSDLFHSKRNTDTFKFRREFTNSSPEFAVSHERWRSVAWEGFGNPPSGNSQ